MKMITWNVNGLRSVMGKGFPDFVRAEQADFILLQETKVDPATIDFDWLPDYHRYWNRAAKPGYSGTGILTKHPPLAVTPGIGQPEHDQEGRVLTAEYPGCYIVCVYTPNAQADLVRLPYRMTWDAAFLGYVRRLEQTKPVLIAGDLNVAHQEIDLANPKSNRFNPGFSDQERAGFSNLLTSGFHDAFREFDSSAKKYSWWSYRANARANNVGWRIDYWCTSPRLRGALRACTIRQEIEGSDHCPVTLETDPRILSGS
jgi:exodeoxyribonuclease III